MLVQNYDLDMVPSGIPLTIHVSQYNDDVQLVFKLFASHGTLNLSSGANELQQIITCSRYGSRQHIPVGTNILFCN